MQHHPNLLLATGHGRIRDRSHGVPKRPQELLQKLRGAADEGEDGADDV